MELIKELFFTSIASPTVNGLLKIIITLEVVGVTNGLQPKKPSQMLLNILADLLTIIPARGLSSDIWNSPGFVSVGFVSCPWWLIKKKSGFRIRKSNGSKRSPLRVQS